MRATGRSSAHFKTRSTSNPALNVPSVLEDVPRPPPNMSDDAAQAQREADAPAVGTVRKAEDAPGGDAERAAPRAKVSAEDLARALGGAVATAAVKADTSDAPVGPNFGVQEGDRVEVRWVISEAREDEDPAETVVWWGATARARSVAGSDAASSGDARSSPAWELRYDAHLEAGFAAETRPVVFTSAETLEDPGEGTSLRWRREGDAADGDDDSFDAGDGDGARADPNVVHVAAPPADEKGNVSISALLSAQREVDERANGGRSLEQQGAEAFQTLPMDSQQKMASAFAGLRDGLSRAFAELQERNGPDYAITKDDIAEIMRTMHAR